jgi:hypothetical protein
MDTKPKTKSRGRRGFTTMAAEQMMGQQVVCFQGEIALQVE